MTPITLPAGVPPAVHRRRTLSWALYDWANSAVVTLIIAAVFPIFFNAIARPALGDQAASAFSFSVSLALFISILMGPVIGTLADMTGGRKRLLIVFTLLGVATVLAMYTIGEGAWQWAAILYVFFQIFLSTCFGLYNALLSHIAPTEEQDKLSSLGYALGYFGGGIQLALSLIFILFWENIGLPDQSTGTRVALVFSGIWWLVFSIPLFMNVPEPPATPISNSKGPIRDAFANIWATFKAARHYSELFKMLIAFMVYNSGIGTIITLATTYGQQEIGLDQTVLIGALLLTQFVAFPFALMYGRIPDEKAKRRTVYIAHMLWTAVTFPIMGSVLASQNAGTATVFAAIAANQGAGGLFSWFVGARLVRPHVARLDTKWAIIFGLAIYVVCSVWGFFLYSAAEFWLLAFLVGTVQGGTQALSRSLYASLSPRAKSGEFFGLYGLSDKSAGIFGPLLFGLVGLSGNLRPAILSVIVFFVLGSALLLTVRVKEGQRVAEDEDRALGIEEVVG